MSNLINDIEIKNFKSIRHQKIEGCKRVNVFIGYPNVGKSNILEALSTLVYLRGNDEIHISSLCRFENFSEIFFEGNWINDATINCNDQTGIRLSYFSDNSLKLHTQKLDVTNNDWIQYYAIEFRETSEILALGSSLDNVPNVKKYQYKSDIEYRKSRDVSLQIPFGENLFSLLISNEALRKEAEDLFSVYDLKLIFDKGLDKMRVFRNSPNESNSIFSLPYKSIADTLQRLIFYQTAVQTNSNSILIFEEPEAHMFPPYIRKFTSEVIFDKTNQFFITTHSPFVLDEFIEEIPDEISVYLVDYRKGETIVSRLSENDLDEVRKYGVDLFFNIESYLKNGQINNA